MNIILDVNRFSIGNIFFLDKKRNIIIDGNFTKMIYSNEYFTMNCLYFLFPIEISKTEKTMNKTNVFFHPYSRHNTFIMQEFSKLEYTIIEYYKTMNNSFKKISNNLSKQIYSGNVKIYNSTKNYNGSQESNKHDIETRNNYVVKISGLWETEQEIGITYKLYKV